MTTIQINERSKAGKALLELARFISKEQKGVKIIEPEKKDTPKPRNEEYPISKNIPNAETLKAMRNAEKGIGVKKFESVEELFDDLEI
ncbi:MAG TPA: type II toxin-antitoxin system RelB/DinJ family antitoxin [Salinimicrobium sp.]|nr:type II toxin-antitoxin system RelB/DinJ family antitoxin [Salinimicrobium sp.]